MTSTILYEVYCLYTPKSAPVGLAPDQREKKVFGVADLKIAHVAATYLNQVSSMMGTANSRLAEMRDWEIACKELRQPGNIVPLGRSGDMLGHALQWLGLDPLTSGVAAHAT